MGLFKVGEIVGLKSDPNAKASIISIKQVGNPTSYEIFYNNERVEEGSKDFPWEKMPWE